MNYIGSKHSLIEFIKEIIQNVSQIPMNENCVFADLFAGTGVVGTTYRELGCTVLSNDLQYYSYALQKHFIENTNSVDTSLVDYFNNLLGIDGCIYKNYCAGSGSGRLYFSDENGRKCDAIRTELERMYLEKQIDQNTYFFYLASLIDSIDKYANTASVYGAYLKKIKATAQKTFTLAPLQIVDGPVGKAYNEDATELIHRISGDILYLDPPYNARQYCTNYHVLETIARYDNPETRGTTGLRDYTNQKSDFCSKRNVQNSFEEIIRSAQFKYIFLSYNNEGLMSLNTIEDIMSRYGKYSFYTKEYRRFKADNDQNRNITANSTVEYLHCLEK